LETKFILKIRRFHISKPMTHVVSE